METSTTTEGHQTKSPKRWPLRYTSRLRLIDAGVVVWAVAGAFGIRFGFADIGDSQVREVDYLLLSIALVIG